MSLHGVIVRADGSKVTVRIGEDEGDPVFVVTDLLPHLGGRTVQAPRNKADKGRGAEYPRWLEDLSEMIRFKRKGKAQSAEYPFREIRHSRKVISYSAELECVPAFKAKDVGFDRSLVGAYGQDDRVCAYTAFTAIIDMKAVPKRPPSAFLPTRKKQAVTATQAYARLSSSSSFTI